MEKPAVEAEAISPANISLKLVLLLGLFQAMISLSIEVYVPALPAISRALSGGSETLGMTMTGFFLGIALGQAIWGPISDRLGRKRLLFAGIGLYCIAAIGCAFASSGLEMIIWRTLQAIGASAPPVIASAMVRDIADQDEGPRVRSSMQVVSSAVGLTAPILGAQLLLFGWRFVFVAMALFAALLMLGLMRMSRQLPPDRPKAASLLGTFGAYGYLLTKRRFLGHLLPGVLMMAALGGYLSGSPFIFIDHFGWTPHQYGLLVSMTIVGMGSAAFLSRQIVKRVSSPRLLRWGLSFSFIAAAFLIMTDTFGPQEGLWLAVPLVLTISVIGLNNPNAAAGALEDFPDRAGAAAALYGATESVSAAAAAAIVATMADETPSTVCAIVFCASCLAGISHYLLIVRRDGILRQCRT